MKQHYNQWEVICLLQAIMNPQLEVPTLRYGQIYNILFGGFPNPR